MTGYNAVPLNLTLNLHTRPKLEALKLQPKCSEVLGEQKVSLCARYDLRLPTSQKPDMLLLQPRP